MRTGRLVWGEAPVTASPPTPVGDLTVFFENLKAEAGVSEQLGALLDKEFLAQDLPKLTPNAETASELISEAV
jgi:hypothetical protein